MAVQVKGRPAHVVVMQANATAPAKALCELIEERLDCTEMLMAFFTPVVGVGAGPELLDIALYPEQRATAHVS